MLKYKQKKILYYLKNRINLIELFNKDGVIVYKNFDKLIHVCNEIFKKNKVPDKDDNIINYSSKNEFLKINEFGKKFIIDKSENFNLLKKSTLDKLRNHLLIEILIF